MTIREYIERRATAARVFTVIWVLVVIVLALLVFRNVVAILIEHLIPRAGGLLHCPEPAAPFLAIWYLLGMLVPTAIGAWLGPRLLRW